MTQDLASKDGARTASISPRLAVVVTVVILVIVNVVDVKVPHASLVAGPVCAAVLLGLGTLAGLSWAELGVGPGTRGQGAGSGGRA